MEKPLFPQALTTSFHYRVKNDSTALYITTQTSRGTKRTAAVVNYAEDYFDDNNDDDDDDDDDKDTSDEDFGSRNTRRGHHNAQVDLDPNNLTGNALLNNFQGKFAQKTTSKITYSTSQLVQNSQLEENLIPVRINLEHNNSRIVDFFMWNLNETLISPEKFAEITCLDLELPHNIQTQMANSIHAQIEEYSQQNLLKNLPDDLSIRVIIDLSVNLDKQLYEDKFEWDLTNKSFTPNHFAEIVVSDLGISREFYPAISHALYEALIKAKKDAVEGRLPNDVINGAAYGKEAGWRFDPENLGQEWCPTVETLSQWELEKREIERERNIRRLKRETMRVEGEGRRGARRGARRYDELEGTWVNY